MDDLTDRLRTAVRRIKRLMRYRGSMQTDDFVDDLVARWVARGHYEAMREANAGYLAVSVRNRILDDITKPRLTTDPIDAAAIDLPAPDDLARLVDLHLMRAWVDNELSLLTAGQVADLPVKPSDPALCARIIRATLLEGQPQRDLATTLGCAVATINAHHQIGVAYLALRASAAGWSS